MQKVEADKIPILALRVRTYLQHKAIKAERVTYKALADAMKLTPPKTINQITRALEYLMEEDALNKHPFIAALVVSRGRRGLPGLGFFEIAHQLGYFSGDPSGTEAAAFHAKALTLAIAYWGAENRR